MVRGHFRPWSDGTTGIKLSPLELLEKLAALVPAACPLGPLRGLFGACRAGAAGVLEGVRQMIVQQFEVQPDGAGAPGSRQCGGVSRLRPPPGGGRREPPGAGGGALGPSLRP